MTSQEFANFKLLMQNVYFKASYSALKKLSETEANSLAVLIEERTGMTISGKTIINFINAILKDTPNKINPSLVSLDTLARYCLDIPRGSDQERKKQNNYIYWYQYCEQLRNGNYQTYEPSIQKEIPNNNIEEENPFLNKNNKRRWIALFISLFFLILTLFLMPQKTTNYTQNFDFSTPQQLIDSLKRDGWIIIDEDSAFLYKQNRPGALTLYTLAGDYWVKPKEEPIIKNLLLKKINCGSCCEIIIKIDDFRPDCRHQQVAIMIFGSDFSKNAPHLRYALLNTDTDQWEYFQSIYIPLCIYEIVNNTGKVLYANSPYDSFDAKLPRKDFIIRLRYTNNSYILSGMSDYEWTGEKEFYRNSDTNFKPKYIALAAFHGLTHDDYIPLYGDTIPAYINYIKIEPCSN